MLAWVFIIQLAGAKTCITWFTAPASKAVARLYFMSFKDTVYIPFLLWAYFKISSIQSNHWPNNCKGSCQWCADRRNVADRFKSQSQNASCPSHLSSNAHTSTPELHWVHSTISWYIVMHCLLLLRNLVLALTFRHFHSSKHNNNGLRIGTIHVWRLSL